MGKLTYWETRRSSILYIVLYIILLLICKKTSLFEAIISTEQAAFAFGIAVMLGISNSAYRAGYKNGKENG